MFYTTYKIKTRQKSTPHPGQKEVKDAKLNKLTASSPSFSSDLVRGVHARASVEW